jgi:hypothetical protein
MLITYYGEYHCLEVTRSEQIQDRWPMDSAGLGVLPLNRQRLRRGARRRSQHGRECRHPRMSDYGK